MAQPTLSQALDALAVAAERAGVDPEMARLEGEALAAAVAEPAPGAFVDWSREVGIDDSAQAFMEASSRGRRYRSTPTPLVTQLRAKDPALANAYATALSDVCAAACLLGAPTPQVAGAATMASAAQFASGQYGATPPAATPAAGTPAPHTWDAPAGGASTLATPGGTQTVDGPFPGVGTGAEESFLAKAPAVLTKVLGQLREAQQSLMRPGLDLTPHPGRADDPFDLSALDAHAPGAFDLTTPGVPGTSSAPLTQQSRQVPASPAAPGAVPAAPVAPRSGDAAAAAEPDTTTATQAEAATADAAEPEKTVEELLAELDSLVGLARVKAEIRRQSAILRVEGLRSKEGLKSPTITRHLIFVGNPGTGKTTVARLVAGIYKALGLLTKGQLVEVDRSELVAGYLGQTAIKTAEVVARAEGGVLFIDEAYSLNGDQYGEEAINTLVKEMEDKRDNLVVIVAGYPLPMAEFIANNPGLNSRFRTTIEFDDYTDDELVGIFRGMATSADYDLADGVEEKFREMLSHQVRDFTFGNGRYARNTMEAAVGRHAWRLRDVAEPTLEQLRTLLPEDLADDDAATVDWPPAGTLDVAAEAAFEANAEATFDAESPGDDTLTEPELPSDAPSTDPGTAR